jgi:hypothetical protein
MAAKTASLAMRLFTPASMPLIRTGWPDQFRPWRKGENGTRFLHLFRIDAPLFAGVARSKVKSCEEDGPMPSNQLGAYNPFSSDGRPCDPRFCRTHALVADLFAKSSGYRVNAAAWAFNAQAWAELADLKQRTKENNASPAGGGGWRGPAPAP